MNLSRDAGPQPETDIQLRLEELDDVIFPAIEGRQEVDVAEKAWKATVAEVGKPAVEESRREYLRYAYSTWRLLTTRAIHEPLRFLAVLKIIGMLLGDDS